MLVLASRLYNAALEERIGNWKYGLRLAAVRGPASPHDLPKDVWRPVTFVTQCAALTTVRADDPDGYGALPTNVAREVLKRLDLAFQRFFARAKAGKGKAGYPRFKSAKRWRSFAWNEMNGVRVVGDKVLFELFGEKRSLRFKRHKDWPEGARPCSVRLVRKVSRWEAHVQIEHPVEGEIVRQAQAKPDKTLVADLDPEIAALWLKEFRAVEKRKADRQYALDTAADEERRKALFLEAWNRGEVRGWDANIVDHLANDQGLVLPNPRIGKAAQKRRSKYELEVARSKRGSKRRAKAVLRLRKCHEQAANARRTLAHQQSALVVRTSVFNAFEGLQIANMTASAAGTVGEPGTNVAAHSARSREMLDCAHGTRLTYVRYKAARAGGWTVTVPPAGTTATCSKCRRPGRPDEDRIFRCRHCSFEMDRDQNAGRNIVHVSRGVVAPSAPARRDQGRARVQTAISN